MHLVARAQGGDADALDQLLRQHLPDLRIFVRAKSGEQLRAQESCSDLVQTVCREALQGLQAYEWRGEGSFRRWLFTLAINKIRNRADHWNAERRRPAREVPGHGDESREGALAQAYVTRFGPSRHAIGNEAVERFEQCLDQLEESQREVILLSRVVGLEHGEIAKQLSLEPGAVRTRLSRALARLATLMSHDA